MAAMPARLTASGVGRSGSPAVKSRTFRPAAASALALAARPRVGESSTWRNRSASVTAVMDARKCVRRDGRGLGTEREPSRGWPTAPARRSGRRRGALGGAALLLWLLLAGPQLPQAFKEPLLLRGPEFRLGRSEEHTSELQSQSNLVCRLLLEKKKKQRRQTNTLTVNSFALPLFAPGDSS